MKKVKIYWTPFALKSLDQIEEYIQQATYSKKIASNYIQKLINRVEQLYTQPDSGQTEELLKHLNQNSRYLVEGNYKIIYQHNNNIVIITDVFHVKQNPVKIIKRNKR
jgi:plasmid stabilization system protein ParE